MIVPVLRTTGVNTKILVALELGVPLVITPVCSSSTTKCAVCMHPLLCLWDVLHACISCYTVERYIFMHLLLYLWSVLHACMSAVPADCMLAEHVVPMIVCESPDAGGCFSLRSS